MSNSINVESSDGPEDVATWLRTTVQPRVDQRLEAVLADSEFDEQLRYQIEAGGKRLRPGLTFLVGRLCGLSMDDLVDVAAGVELLHTFTLVHDDIVDGDERRRDQPSLWMAYGEGQALNLGDMLFAYAVDLFPDEYKKLALERSIWMGEGHQMELEFERRRDVDLEEYLTMTRKKTGALLDLCLEVPQRMTGMDLPLDDYSLLGTAFQIRDDLLDFEQGANRQVGSDVRAGRRTLPVVHADDDRVYDILEKPAADTTSEDVERVETLLRAQGSFAFGRRKMFELVGEALECIEHLPDSREATMLEQVLNYVVARDV